MSFISPPKVKAPPPPPKVTDPNVQQTEADARKRAALARGRQSTILSQPRGLGIVGA